MTSAVARGGYLERRTSQILRAGANWMGHPSFVWICIAVYVLSGIVYALVVSPSFLYETSGGVTAVNSGVVVPDEDRHIGAILYYADRGWWRGPVITDLPAAELVKGELERTPSYLYYYVMSIFVSGFHLFSTDYDATVVFIRLLTLLIGAAGLVVVWKLLGQLGFGPRTAGFATAAFSLTGRWVWQGAGVSYDVPSTVLFFLFLLFAVYALKGRGAHHVLLAATFGLLSGITKYTYVPFVGVGLILLLVLFLRDSRSATGSAFGSLVSTVRARSKAFWFSVAAAVVAGGLFVERIGWNVIRYRAVEPSCPSVHDEIACQNFGIYVRNATARQDYLDALSAGQPPAQYSPFEYTGEWLNRYYSSLFFYIGRTSERQINQVTLLLCAAIVLVLVVMLVVNRTPLLFNRTITFVASICAVYVLATYAVNVNTYLRYEQYYAHQGRYLLPVLPLLYALIVRLIVSNWRRIRGVWRYMVCPVVAIVGVAAFVAHLQFRGLLLFPPFSNWF
jgi:hypothetical protein